MEEEKVIKKGKRVVSNCILLKKKVIQLCDLLEVTFEIS